MSNNKQERKDPTICPHCEHKNEPETTHCAKCGRQLLLTVPMPDTSDLAEIQLSRGIPDADTVSLMADTLAFLIPGFTEPLHVEQKDEMVLGRQVPSEPAPEIDLTVYNAYAMGVSRRHALIRSSADGYIIEDLGSANGTWVNENRLPPHKPRALNSGDQIRIGHLVLFVYFKALMSIFLVETGAPLVRRRKLTPHFLANHVSPYLRALAEIQFIVDDMLGRAPSEVALHTISASANGVFNIRLEKVADAIKLVKEVIQPWTSAYIDGAEVIKAPESVKPNEAQGSEKKETTQEQDSRKTGSQDVVQTSDRATTSAQETPTEKTEASETTETPETPDTPKSEQTEQVEQSEQSGQSGQSEQSAPSEQAGAEQRRTTQEIVREAALDLLINQVIRHVAPRLPDQDKTGYAKKLKVALPVLITSTLELSDTPSEPQE